MAAQIGSTVPGILSRSVLHSVPSCSVKVFSRMISSTRPARFTTNDVNGVESEVDTVTNCSLDAKDTSELESAWKRKFLNTQYRCDAIFVLGPMGAGKTLSLIHI